MTLQGKLSQPEGILKLAGAHNVMGAKLAQEAGFEGIWASSFEIATSHGVSDDEVMTWQQLHEVAAEMAQAVELPIVADCEAGFGGPEVVRELVSAHESAGVAAICMEDCAFPRRCSLLPGTHGLAPQEEFTRKIEAALGARDRLLVLARLQALVAGRGMQEALKRGRAYADAGADAIVVHSRSKQSDEVLEFVARWDRDAPLVVIPTTYHSLTLTQMQAAGKIRMAIYANHGLRAAISAMKRALRQILSEGTSHGVETWIAGLDDAFALQSTPVGVNAS
jgi:phosphoenolpyruvate phosphomutase